MYSKSWPGRVHWSDPAAPGRPESKASDLGGADRAEALHSSPAWSSYYLPWFELMPGIYGRALARCA